MLTTESNTNTPKLLGPYFPGNNGFTLLYDDNSKLKPFFTTLTKETAKMASPLDVIIPSCSQSALNSFTAISPPYIKY